MTEKRLKEGAHVYLNKWVGTEQLKGVLQNKDKNNKWTIKITSPNYYKDRILYFQEEDNLKQIDPPPFQEENNLTKTGGRKSRRGGRKSRRGGRKSRRGGRKSRRGGRKSLRRGGRKSLRRGGRKTRRGGKRTRVGGMNEVEVEMSAPADAPADAQRRAVVALPGLEERIYEFLKPDYDLNDIKQGRIKIIEFNDDTKKLVTKKGNNKRLKIMPYFEELSKILQMIPADYPDSDSQPDSD